VSWIFELVSTEFRSDQSCNSSALAEHLLQLCKFDVFIVVLLKMQFSWDVTLCGWASGSCHFVDRTASIFRVMQSKKTLKVKEL
jgi:hypothetical protein